MNTFWLDGVDLPNLRQPPVSALTAFMTPTEKVFCLNHMGVPFVDRDTWDITVDGLVDRRVTLSLTELRDMSQHKVRAFHECCGNPLQPTIPVRRVANVAWQGVALADVLAAAGVRSEARFVWSTGADGGDYRGTHVPAYVKDLPIAEVARPEVMLALRMNGEDLDVERGGPVRLVVPGYYGTNSTKWLRRLTLRESRSPGHFTTAMYNDRTVEDGREVAKPVWRVAPHSIIVEPAHDTPLRQGVETLVSGWTWAAAPIAAVEVSVDGGEWRPAETGERREHAWQPFSFPWTPRTLGRVRLASRAFDVAGRGQPPVGARNCVFSISVSVAEA